MAALPEGSSKTGGGSGGASDSDGGIAKFSVSAEELKDVLECPVCLKVPRQPPIYQCERGHCICSVCHAKLTNCPVCRIPLGKTRSLIFEKVLSKMPHSCKFSDYGCKLEHTKTQLETHEKDCGYRLVNCVDLACQTQVPMAQLVEHMKKDHEREDFVHTESNTYRSHFIVQSSDFTGEIMWISDHIVFEDRHFFRECCRSKDGQWFVWVYMIGSRKECEEYIYTVKIMSDDREEELMYRGRCVPLDVAKEKLVQVGNCLIFPDSTAKRFWANQRIHYQVYVVNRKSKMAAKSNQVEKGKVGSSVPQGDTVSTSGEHHLQTSSSNGKDNAAAAAAATNEQETASSNEKSPRRRASSSAVTSSTTKSKQPGSKTGNRDSQTSTSQDGTTSSSSHHSQQGGTGGGGKDDERETPC